MKISQLITKLEDFKYRRGDLEVEVRNSAGEFDCVEDVRTVTQGWKRTPDEVLVIDVDDGDPIV